MTWSWDAARHKSPSDSLFRIPGDTYLFSHWSKHMRFRLWSAWTVHIIKLPMTKKHIKESYKVTNNALLTLKKCMTLRYKFWKLLSVPLMVKTPPPLTLFWSRLTRVRLCLDNYVMSNVIHFLLAFVPGVREETFSVSVSLWISSESSSSSKTTLITVKYSEIYQPF